MFLQKVHVGRCSQKNVSHFGVSFSTGFFRLIALSGASRQWEFKKTTKNVLPKKGVEKLLQNIDKTVSNPNFSRFVSITFGAVLGEGSSKATQNKHRGKKSDPGPFLASDPPTHPRGSPISFLPVPCRCLMAERPAKEN
jgi:hypothetical protein